MAFIDHIDTCNRHDPSRYLRFWVDGIAVGKLRPHFAKALAECCKQFELSGAGLSLQTPGGSLKTRSAGFAQLVAMLVEREMISHLHGEQYIATPTVRDQGVLLVDRAAAPYFGIRAFGQHINGYVRSGDQLMMWVGRRSNDRKHYPGHLDNLAAGGLPYNISLEENLRKECWEEAAIPAELSMRARPVGAISYCTDTDKGCKLDTLYCYDLELPGNFVPRCTDGEVESFQLMPIEEVLALVRDSNEFKLNCNLVIIDFLIRHGYIGPDEPSYLELVTGLHRPLPSF